MTIYDCLFFCINGDIYNNLTPEQQKVVDEAGQKAVDYERAINRAGDDEIMNRWQNENGVKITKYEDMDIDPLNRRRRCRCLVSERTGKPGL